MVLLSPTAWVSFDFRSRTHDLIFCCFARVCEQPNSHSFYHVIALLLHKITKSCRGWLFGMCYRPGVGGGVLRKTLMGMCGPGFRMQPYPWLRRANSIPLTTEKGLKKKYIFRTLNSIPFFPDKSQFPPCRFLKSRHYRSSNSTLPAAAETCKQ